MVKGSEMKITKGDPYFTGSEMTESILEAVTSLKMGEDPEKAILTLLALREAKALAAEYFREAEKLVASLLKGQKEAEIGDFSVKVRFAKSRKWSADNTEDLRNAVIRLARFEPATGEERSSEEVAKTITEAFRCGGAEARLTWLERNGIDPDEYSAGEWKPVVTIEPKQKKGSK